LWLAIRSGRRQYAGFLIHLGFVALVVGVAGSSLGTRQQDLDMRVGQVVPWAGCDVQLVAIRQRSEPDKLIGEAELELSRGGRTIGVVRPAQHFHLLQQAWTTEVAIHATWRGDVYVILHGGDEGEQVRMTLVENPLMRWLWLSGGIIGLGTLWRLWPVRRRQTAAAIIPLPEMRRRNASRSEAA
jgi:cytochrome c-type biogenesis protein CcmF